jgi:hypothetical protein
MKFWDSSAIIPLCIDQEKSGELKKLAKKDSGIVCWWGTWAECHSAFSRLYREKILNEKTLVYSQKILVRLREAWLQIEPSIEMMNTVKHVLYSQPLKAADSLQLTAALVWCDHKPDDHEFVCLDSHLSKAARLESFTVVPALS